MMIPDLLKMLKKLKQFAFKQLQEELCNVIFSMKNMNKTTLVHFETPPPIEFYGILQHKLHYCSPQYFIATKYYIVES